MTMQRLAWTVLLAAAGLASPAALAREPIRPGDAPNIVIPQRGVTVMPRHRPDGQAYLTAVEVKVSITEQVASTSLRMTLRNDGGRVQEAQVLAPVPDGAVFSHFELEGLGEEGIARILPRDEARRIYDEIVRATRDPALLEFVGYNLIKSSVFPVPPRGEQTVRLVFEQVLTADAGRIEYILPRSESLDQGGIAWSYSLDIRSKRPIATVYSPSHDLATERLAPDRVLVKVTPSSAARDPGALRISYLLEAPGDGEFAASLLAYPDATVGDGQGGYFMLLAAFPPDSRRQKVAREVIVVLDRSGSMRGAKWDQAREAALQIVEGLSEGERFNIVDYSDTVAAFADGPVAKSPETIAQARKYLDSLTAQGGTNIHDALTEALRQEHAEGTLPMVLFLTDGLPTIGERSEVAIREGAKRSNIHRRRIFTFGVGFDVNSPLLSGLANASRATSTFVLPEEDVEVKVGQVFRRLSGPVLSSPVLTVLDAGGNKTTRQVRELMPAELPDVFDGDQMLLLGQYAADKPIRLRVEGEYLGRPRAFEMSFNVDRATTRNAYVPRLWASRKIALMIEEIRQASAENRGSEDPRMRELVDEIVHLSTKWGILTEYTAFLATERTVGGRPMADGAPARPGEFLRRTEESLSARNDAPGRAGAGGVNQESNINQRKQAGKVDARNRYLDADMKEVETTAIRQISDQTLYKRGARWVEAGLLKDEEAAPDQVVEFGTPEFSALLETLSRSNRQGVLAIGGEVYLLIDGQRILVRSPEAK